MEKKIIIVACKSTNTLKQTLTYLLKIVTKQNKISELLNFQVLGNFALSIYRWCLSPTVRICTQCLVQHRFNGPSCIAEAAKITCLRNPYVQAYGCD